EHDWTRHGNLDDLQPLPAGSARIFQAAQVRVQGHVVFAPLIRFDHRDHGIGSAETCDVVNVSVGVVAGDAAVEPDDGLCAKIVGEHSLIGRAVHGRVALLCVGEQAFLGGDESAAA